MKQLLILCVLVSTALGVPKRTGPDSRIYNGRDATYGEFPYMVSVQDSSFGYDNPICGGAIYNENYVITAASCLYGKDLTDPSFLKVYAGDYMMTDTDGNEQKIKLDNVIINENFNIYTHFSDIALLHVKTPLNFSSPYAQPIAIPAQGATFTGACSLTGWGRKADGLKGDILQVATYTLITDDDCRAVYGIPDVEDAMICGNGGTQGGCSGDVGAPLACVTDKPYITGIATYSSYCGDAAYPGVFAEVAYYNDWIVANAV